MSDAKKPQIIIYSASWCAYCHSLMQWLNKLDIPYTAKDIEADPAALDELMAKTDGGQNIPVTDIAGDIIIGFDRPKIQASLETHGLKPTK